MYTMSVHIMVCVQYPTLIRLKVLEYLPLLFKYQIYRGNLFYICCICVCVRVQYCILWVASSSWPIIKLIFNVFLNIRIIKTFFQCLNLWSKTIIFTSKMSWSSTLKEQDILMYRAAKLYLVTLHCWHINSNKFEYFFMFAEC